MGKHHVAVSQLSIECGGKVVAPYMNVVARDFVALGVITHGHGQKTFLWRNQSSFIGLFAFPNIDAFNEYSAERPGHWQEVESLPMKEGKA